jgi:cytochrome c
MRAFGIMAAAAFTVMAAAPASAQAAKPYTAYKGNAVAGKSVFLQCMACHAIEAGKNKVGPSLHAVVGRKAGIVPAYNYSAANKNSGIVWTEAKLFEYLVAPRKTVPGTKMAFAGLADPQKRADVIAYLKANS